MALVKSKHVKVLLVPACEVVKFNKLGSKSKKRCKKVIKILNKKRYDYLVVCGGIFNPTNTQTISASELMRAYLYSLTQNGQALKKVIILSDSQSLETWQNIEFGLERLRTLKLSPRGIENLPLKVTVVSHFQHLFRIFIICLLGYKLWIKPVPVFSKVTFKEWLLEVLGFFYTMYDPKGTGKIAQKIRTKRRP